MAMFEEEEEILDSIASDGEHGASLCDKILDDNLELDGFEEEISSTGIVELETSTSQISTSGIETATKTFSDDKVEGSKLNELFEVALEQGKAEDPTGSTQKKLFAFPRMPRPVKVNPPFEPFENRSREVKVEDPNLVSDSFGRIVEKKYSRCHW
ncbi:unnamed protein product, partial [Mesorhabditis belari]|uniref:Uncharacterized protein n=1 Tax=Mesorhabditis belari TaxID=2138241 RepID=A0AAF3EIR6_9BILA